MRRALAFGGTLGAWYSRDRCGSIASVGRFGRLSTLLGRCSSPRARWWSRARWWWTRKVSPAGGMDWAREAPRSTVALTQSLSTPGGGRRRYRCARRDSVAVSTTTAGPLPNAAWARVTGSRRYVCDREQVARGRRPVVFENHPFVGRYSACARLSEPLASEGVRSRDASPIASHGCALNLRRSPIALSTGCSEGAACEGPACGAGNASTVPEVAVDVRPDSGVEHQGEREGNAKHSRRGRAVKTTAPEWT